MAPEVGAGRADSSGTRSYVVCDDGVGFDMSYAEMLFGPFHRIHLDVEFPGILIELSLARCAVRATRRIWSGAAPVAGATLWLTPLSVRCPTID